MMQHKESYFEEYLKTLAINFSKDKNYTHCMLPISSWKIGKIYIKIVTFSLVYRILCDNLIF